jgi:cell division transport system ATP-binding protein
MSEESIIQFFNVSLRYDHRVILQDVDFSLKQGEFCYMIGNTGVGKSSFLRLIYRDIQPDSGYLTVSGYNTSLMKNKQVPLLRRRLGIVFQDFQLLPDRDVYENIAFALHVTETPKKLIKDKVFDVLNLVGLSHKRKGMPDDLSGGEQQRVVIARALVNEPRLLLADEPTGNLDPEASAVIMELMQTINNRGMGILMVTHDHQLVKKYPARCIRLQDGKLIELSASDFNE